MTPDDRYQSVPGIMHGGLVATLADELPFGTRQPIWEYDVRDALAGADVV